MAKGKRYIQKPNNHKKLKFLILLFIVLLIVFTIYFFEPKNIFFKLTSAKKEATTSNLKTEDTITENEKIKKEDLNIKNEEKEKEKENEIVEKSEIINSNISEEKRIQGLYNIKVLNVDVKSSKNFSIITLSLKNESEQQANSCKLHLSLFDNDNNYVYATSLTMPKIEAYSEIKFSIACSKKIEIIGNYTIELESSNKK